MLLVRSRACDSIGPSVCVSWSCWTRSEIKRRLGWVGSGWGKRKSTGDVDRDGDGSE
jgi:hypothetical protein